MIRRAWLLGVVLVLAAASLGTPASRAAAQESKQSKAAKDNKDTQAKDAAPVVPYTDQQTLESDISEMLGAWQIGDVALMHKHYADDVLVVSGFWEPPVRGWESYAQSYQRQRSRMVGVQLNRSNTFLKVDGNTAWAVYQWMFTGQVDGQFAAFRGHTTLVFEKRAGNWLIIVNHTSIAEPPPTPPAAPPATPPAAPTKPS